MFMVCSYWISNQLSLSIKKIYTIQVSVRIKKHVTKSKEQHLTNLRTYLFSWRPSGETEFEAWHQPSGTAFKAAHAKSCPITTDTNFRDSVAGQKLSDGREVSRPVYGNEG